MDVLITCGGLIGFGLDYGMGRSVHELDNGYRTCFCVIGKG